MPPLMKSRRITTTSPKAGLYWGIAAVLGGVVATYAYVKSSGPSLDKGVNPQEGQAIRYAFANEKDPKNLRNFARSLLPSFPIAATALASKATMLTPFKPGMGETAAASAASAAPKKVSPLSTLSALSGSKSRVSGLAPRNAGFVVGNVLDDIASVPSTLADAASDVGNALIHPADTASGAWHAVTHPQDSFTDFANGLVDALHLIPGMDEAGELLKKFAHWGPGEWCLRVMATYGYYVLAPYLGAQLAAVSFALPGVVKAEPFISSWIKETISRVIATAAILLPVIGGAIAGTIAGAAGGALSEATNKFLAENPEFQRFVKEMMDQIGKASETLQKEIGPVLAKKIEDGLADAIGDVTKALGKKYGLPPDFAKIARDASGTVVAQGANGLTIALNASAPVREDNAAAAYDLLAKTNYQGTTKWDPITGEDIEAHLAKARFQSVQNVSKTALTSAYKDPRTLSVQEALARREVSVADLVNPPERAKWVRFYLNKERFAKALQASPKTPAPAIGFGRDYPTKDGSLPAGSYMVEFESQSPGGSGVPELFYRNGMQTTGMRQIGPNQYRIFIRTPQPFQLRNFPGLRWLISRRIS